MRSHSLSKIVPTSKVPLYPHQVEAVEFLIKHPRAILGDDMGLGKTFCAIEAIQRLGRIALVICPVTLTRQWKKEITRFSDLNVVVIEGDKYRRVGLYDEPADIYVVNYEKVLRDFDLLADLPADIIILDEGQRIKNHRSKISEHLKELGEYRYKWLLTGTPLENSLKDLESLLEFLDLPLQTLPSFQAAYKFQKQSQRSYQQRAVQLTAASARRRLRGVMLRRLKSMVLEDLPPKVINTHYIKLDPFSRRFYNRIRFDLLAQLDDGTLSYMNALAKLQYLRQACISPAMIGGKPASSPKIEALLRILEDIGDEKVVIFTEYRKALRIVATELDRRGIEYAQLHGGIGDHQKEIDRFNGSVNVMLATKTGELGHNLQVASFVIHLDLPYNPARVDQREDRLHRIGQKKTVNVVKLIVTDSIEERVLEILGEKRDLFERVINAGLLKTDWRTQIRQIV
ncbi:hypothetical protein LCGC14_0610160 [marine sediment metagenome]|uniref:DEAD/DEAH box helicase n=1 Tax=marine sediment metagenome TaxID=412755 RepID=A0A0F9UGD9_9ZZZZ